MLFARWEKAFCVPSVQRLLAFAHDQEWQVIHVGTQHRSADSLPYLHRIRGRILYCLEQGYCCDFVVNPEPGVVTLYKNWYSAFETNLKDYVSEDDIVLWAGVSTDCCIQASAFDADRSELRSIIPIEAVSASTSELFSASLVGLGKSVATIVSVDAVLAGANLRDPAIRIEDIEIQAETWFRRLRRSVWV